MWTNYWVQWVVQNVLPPSFWTLAGITASHLAQRRRQNRQHRERMDQADRHHQALKDHVAAVLQPTAPMATSSPVKDMTAEEFEAALRDLMRRDPRVLDAYLRQRKRAMGSPDTGLGLGGR